VVEGAKGDRVTTVEEGGRKQVRGREEEEFRERESILLPRYSPT